LNKAGPERIALTWKLQSTKKVGTLQTLIL